MFLFTSSEGAKLAGFVRIDAVHLTSVNERCQQVQLFAISCNNNNNNMQTI